MRTDALNPWIRILLTVCISFLETYRNSCDIKMKEKNTHQTVDTRHLVYFWRKAVWKGTLELPSLTVPKAQETRQSVRADECSNVSIGAGRLWPIGTMFVYPHQPTLNYFRWYLHRQDHFPDSSPLCGYALNVGRLLFTYSGGRFWNQ